MRGALKTLRTRVGRVQRDVQRQLVKLPEQMQAKGQDLLQRVGRILKQRTKDTNKLYTQHAPEVECISKGKPRNPYEFGVKVTVATTLKEGLRSLILALLRGAMATPPAHWHQYRFEQLFGAD